MAGSVEAEDRRQGLAAVVAAAATGDAAAALADPVGSAAFEPGAAVAGAVGGVGGVGGSVAVA